MNANGISVQGSRRWALLATGAGVFCLCPIAFATLAWYRHVWHRTWDEFWPSYLGMTALYAVLLAGPTLMLAGGASSLLGGRVRKARWLLVVGSAMTLTYSLLGLAVRPPDLPVRIVIGAMAAASLAVLVWTLRLGART